MTFKTLCVDVLGCVLLASIFVLVHLWALFFIIGFISLIVWPIIVILYWLWSPIIICQFFPESEIYIHDESINRMCLDTNPLEPSPLFQFTHGTIEILQLINTIVYTLGIGVNWMLFHAFAMSTDAAEEADFYTRHRSASVAVCYWIDGTLDRWRPHRATTVEEMPQYTPNVVLSAQSALRALNETMKRREL